MERRRFLELLASAGIAASAFRCVRPTGDLDGDISRLTRVKCDSQHSCSPDPLGYSNTGHPTCTARSGCTIESCTGQHRCEGQHNCATHSCGSGHSCAPTVFFDKTDPPDGEFLSESSRAYTRRALALLLDATEKMA